LILIYEKVLDMRPNIEFVWILFHCVLELPDKLSSQGITEDFAVLHPCTHETGIGWLVGIFVQPEVLPVRGKFRQFDLDLAVVEAQPVAKVGADNVALFEVIRDTNRLRQRLNQSGVSKELG
jgi:hypothetical protein